MVYDMYIRLSSGIGWDTKRSLSEQLREEKRKMEASAERQRKRDAADKKRFYLLKREKTIKSRNPAITIEEMDIAHKVFYQGNIPETAEEIEKKLQMRERKRNNARKNRQEKRKDRYQCRHQK